MAGNRISSRFFIKPRALTPEDPVYSTREIIVLWQYLLKHGIDIDRFFDGVDIPRKKLLDKWGWVDIGTQARLTRNYRACLPDYDMAAAQAVSLEQFDSYAYGFTSTLFRLPSLELVYRALTYIMMFRLSRIEYFKILESDPGSAVVRYSVRPGFEPFIDSSFIYTWSGFLSAIPLLHDLPPARVEILASFVDVFKRFGEDFSQFPHSLRQRDGIIYLDHERAGRWILPHQEPGMDPLIRRHMPNASCILWEKDVTAIRPSGERIFIARKGELYNCPHTLLRLKWTPIGFAARIRNFFYFLKRHLLSRLRSRKALQREAELLYQYSNRLKHQVKEKTDEIQRVQARMFEMEKRAIEHRITGGFAHEMRNALAGAQLDLKAALNYRFRKAPATHRLKQAAQTLAHLLPPSDDGGKESPSIKAIGHELDKIHEIARFMDDILNDVSKDIDRGLSITAQIREYSKLHEINPGTKRISLSPLIREIQTELASLFSRRKIRLMVDCPEDAVCQGDENHFYSIFHNIILNAGDALEEAGTQNPQIHITVEPEKDQLRIRIMDNGPGISPEILPDIFTPFISTKPETGTGLGLSVVSRLVGLYKGRIHARSHRGRGAEFILTLPRPCSDPSGGDPDPSR